MILWIEWFRCVRQLRGACTRHTTFLWMVLVLAAMASRPDLLGVTSFVRASFIDPRAYHPLLNFFHSSALILPKLLEAWVRLVMRLFSPITEQGRIVLVADGLKIPKEGKKMPAVKSLHQESAGNSKPTYIMGHSFQAVSLLVGSPLGQVFAVPLISRICEGLIWSRSAKRISLLDKLVTLFRMVVRVIDKPAFLVADAYYASAKVITPLLEENHHLITRVRINAVAYEPAPRQSTRRPGRPRKYGRKRRLRELFKGASAFREAKSPVYGEENVIIQYRVVDLLWRPVGREVRFVWVKHPTRGSLILLSSSLELDPLTVIKIYGLRFKIEVSFKQAIHTIGTYAYHFWMRPMKPITRGEGDQNIARRSEAYRRAVQRKMDTYHRYVQLGCIVQGLLLHLAINFRGTVWASFRSWLRTMKTDLVPSEMVVAHALRSSFPEFLLDTAHERKLKKLIIDRIEPHRIPGFGAAA